MFNNKISSLQHIENLCSVTNLSFDQVYNLANENYKCLLNADKLVSSTEGLSQILLKILSSVINTVMHLVNTFKTNIFKFYKDLKRSELLYFHESNMVSVSRILKLPYSTILSKPSVLYQIPNGMKKSYKVTTDTLVNCLNLFDMRSKSKELYKLINDTYNALLKEEIRSLDIKLSDNTQSVLKAFKEVQYCLTNVKSDTFLPFKNIFLDNNELSYVDTTLLENDKYLYEISTIANILETTENKCADILKFIQSSEKQIPKDILVHLSKVTMVLAKLFDMYGLAVKDYVKVEHTFTEVLKTLKTEFML